MLLPAHPARVLWFAALLLCAGCGRSESKPVPEAPVVESKPAIHLHSPIHMRIPRAPAGWKDLGTFEVRSGQLVVTDPGYGAEGLTEFPSLVALVSNAQPGAWHALVLTQDLGEWGLGNTVLLAGHVSHELDSKEAWQIQASCIGVDSGQAGFFDLETLGDDSLVPQDSFAEMDPWFTWMRSQFGSWYTLCCSKSDSSIRAGVVPGGVVSLSGYGDGGYDWSLRKDEDGMVVALRIDFVDSPEEE